MTSFFNKQDISMVWRCNEPSAGCASDGFVDWCGAAMSSMLAMQLMECAIPALTYLCLRRKSRVPVQGKAYGLQ
eukprot:1143556-Pelagomonas_calceolata.AAC.3